MNSATKKHIQTLLSGSDILGLEVLADIYPKDGDIQEVINLNADLASRDYENEDEYICKKTLLLNKYNLLKGSK